jgi:hypothetical protein
MGPRITKYVYDYSLHIVNRPYDDAALQELMKAMENTVSSQPVVLSYLYSSISCKAK